MGKKKKKKLKKRKSNEKGLGSTVGRKQLSLHHYKFRSYQFPPAPRRPGQIPAPSGSRYLRVLCYGENKPTVTVMYVPFSEKGEGSVRVHAKGEKYLGSKRFE